MSRINNYVCLLCLSTASWSLSSDHTQPLHAQAKTADFDQIKHISTYTGTVTATQGSTHLTADKLVVTMDGSNHIKSAIADGEPATYQSTPSVNESDIYARAEKIEYYPDQNKLILIGNAIVTRDKDSFASPRIEYDILRQTVISPTSAEGPTHILLYSK